MIVSVSLGKAFDYSIFVVSEGEQVLKRDKLWKLRHLVPFRVWEFRVSAGVLGTEV